MILDNNLLLSSAQAVTSTAASTNYIDKGAAGELGLSGLVVVVTCNTTCTASGAATVQFQLMSDASSGFGTAGNIVIETDAIPKASLVAGYQVFIPVPPGADKQYLQLNYLVATGPLTAGAFSAAVIPRDSIQKYSSIKAANYN